jgi:NTP pyrophosphatase (non-canonical NTP hydrolase)
VQPERPTYDEVVDRVRSFAAVRGWEWYHDPKNLAMAIASEAGELLGELRWLTPSESSPEALAAEQRDAIGLELADVFIFLVTLADVLGIDLPTIAGQKLTLNEARFPTPPA